MQQLNLQVRRVVQGLSEKSGFSVTIFEAWL
jgi:hypothetical protein